MAGVTAFLLMGVENIGVQIEQPFSVLPLELFCSIIKTNIMEALVVRPKPWWILEGPRAEQVWFRV